MIVNTNSLSPPLIVAFLRMEDHDEVIMTITKGNPGAFTIVTALHTMEPVLFPVHLALMKAWCEKFKVYGSDLWVKYKAFGKDIDLLFEHIEKSMS